eukprot:GHRR01033266.1.p1 GENE.GHRR01033266.1~~GHRR01033266.1.p1  ORF type:complete len:120 (-),score=5.30 GHRR01033266.1:635-994(-)
MQRQSSWFMLCTVLLPNKQRLAASKHYNYRRGHPASHHCSCLCPPVLCTGANVWGQLGHGHQVPSEYFNPIAALLKEDVVALQAGDNTSAAICENGQVYLWGKCPVRFWHRTQDDDSCN